MDRVRTRSPTYVRQKSVSSTASGASNSPMMSPVHRHVRSGSTGVGNFRRTQNYAAKAAAQRLAQVMAHQPNDSDSDDDEDDYGFDYNPVSAAPSIGLAPGRGTRPRSPAIGRNNMEQPTSARSTYSTRPTLEQPTSARSTSSTRPALAVKTVPMVPPTVPISLRPPSTTPLETPREVRRETPKDSRRDKRMSVDLGSFRVQELSNNRSSSHLQDELDMLQEENESILEKLRLAEKKCEEAEARTRQLEKQVASLGEGVSMEARLLSRKEAALQQREAALKAATETRGVKSVEATSLRLEVEAARDEATSALEQLHDAECEVKSLRNMTQRMILTKEEMEEVVLKRCWLARYWSLCVKHGIHPEIAGSKYEFWSSLAPLPLEVVLSAGQKAKEENSLGKNDVEETRRTPHDVNDITGEGSIESMLLVEKGLRELASLKVDDAILLAISQQRKPNILKSGHLVSDDLKMPIEGLKCAEAFELSQEEAEDVNFKQAWLTYFWRRAKTHGIEEDIADERLQFWANHGNRPQTSHDAVDAERGLHELKKLGIENQLWRETRKWIDPDGTYTKMQSDDF
ncbi:hypothetical protein ACHQM5_014955 [Ranunculus cassubicifolius]